MATPKKHTVDLTTGPLLSRIICYAVLLILSLLLQLTFNAADLVVVGRFASHEALGAVGATNSLTTLLTTLLFGISTGSCVIVSNFYGAQNLPKLRQAIHTSMKVSLVGGAFLSIVGIAVCRVLLKLMNSPASILDMSTLYMRICFGGMLFNSVYNFGSAILRATGDTKRPMAYLAFAGVINLLLNLVFVCLFKMDVDGVGIATVISQAISAGLVWFAIAHTPEIGGLHLNALIINWPILRSILAIGIPTGLQGISFSVTNILIQATINSFGVLAVAGSTAAGTIESFLAIGSQGFQQTSISFTAQHIGARKYPRLKRSILLCAGLCVVALALPCALSTIYGKKLLAIFTSNPDVIDWGFKRIIVMFPFYSLGCLMNTCTGTMRGGNHATAAFVIILIFACVFRIIWIFGIFPFCPTIEMLMTVYPVSWALITLTGYICIRHYAKTEWR